MTSMNIGSQESRLKRPDLPPLIQYKDLRDYQPNYGDFIVWTGFVTTWCGVVTNYDKESRDIYVIFNGVPFVLFTLSPEEQANETRSLKLEYIKNAPKGKFAIQQRDQTNSATVWFI